MSDLRITSDDAHRVLVVDEKDVIQFAFVIAPKWRIQMETEEC